MENIFQSYIQFQSKLKKRKMAQTTVINVEVNFVDTSTVIMGKLRKINSNVILITLLDDTIVDVFLNDESVVGGYKDIGTNQIELTHVTNGQLILKFRNNFYRDTAINMLKQIFW